MSGYNGSHRRALDFSRVRAQTAGPPRNFISYATVGHSDSTPAYARVEDGDVLVECTLVPAGDEIIARLDLDTVDGGGDYFPVSYGQRLIIGFPNGEQGDPVVLGRCSDKAWPFPDSVAGVSTNLGLPPPAINPAPAFAFKKTQDGQLLAFQTGDGGDVLIHSGASVQAKANAGEQILLTGRTHIGSVAEFVVSPVGASVGPDGFMVQGVQGQAYVPLPNFNALQTAPIPAPPVIPVVSPDGVPYPADAIVRLKDLIQGNQVTDPIFFQYLAYVYFWLDTANGVLDGLTGNAWTPALAAVLATEGILLPAAAPFKLDSKAVEGSLNTCGDD